MKRKCGGRKEKKFQRNGRMVFGVFLFIAAALFTGPAMAIDTEFMGKHLAINGYINQGAQFGVAGDQWDTMQGFQGAIMQALLELEYHPADNVKVFVTGLFNQDWAYPILDDDDDWEDRHFDDSRSEVALFSDYEDYLKECHVTWTPGNLNLRVGKQIVNWGRMDGRRIMDQMNPLDRRRGLTDIEFETTIMPIWMAKAEYYPDMELPGISDYGLEFIFNPNADFITDKGFSTGNNVYGIWGVESFTDATHSIRVGAMNKTTKEPDNWNSDGHEYAFRFKGTLVTGTYFTLNYFDGVANSPIPIPNSNITFESFTDDKGRRILKPGMSEHYPDQKSFGFTFTHDLEKLYISALGAVAPAIRCEALYGFESWFRSDGWPPGGSFGQRAEKHDEINYGIGIDWAFKWNLLNERRNFDFVPEFSHRHIRDYPDNYKLRGTGGGAVSENNYFISLRMSTQYLHDKLEPMIFYGREIQDNLQGDMWLARLSYLPNETWTYRVALYLYENALWDTADSYAKRGLDHKDHIAFTVQYQF